MLCIIERVKIIVYLRLEYFFFNAGRWVDYVGYRWLVLPYTCCNIVGPRCISYILFNINAH